MGYLHDLDRMFISLCKTDTQCGSVCIFEFATFN